MAWKEPSIFLGWWRRKAGGRVELGWGPGTKEMLTYSVLFSYIKGIGGKYDKIFANSGASALVAVFFSPKLLKYINYHKKEPKKIFLPLF